MICRNIIIFVIAFSFLIVDIKSLRDFPNDIEDESDDEDFQEEEEEEEDAQQQEDIPEEAQPNAPRQTFGEMEHILGLVITPEMENHIPSEEDVNTFFDNEAELLDKVENFLYESDYDDFSNYWIFKSKFSEADYTISITFSDHWNDLVRYRHFEVNKIHDGLEPGILEISDRSSYIVLKIVDTENCVTTSRATCSTRKNLEAVHFWIGWKCDPETRKETVKFMKEILNKYSPSSPGTVKIFKETYRLQSRLFRNMFPRIIVEGNAQNPRPHVFQLTVDPANVNRVLICEKEYLSVYVHYDEAVVFHSYRKSEVRVLSVAPRKKFSQSSSNENMHEEIFREYREKQPRAIKNIISLIEYYYGSVTRKEENFQNILQHDFNLDVTPSEKVNLRKCMNGIELREHFYNFETFERFFEDTVTEKRTMTSKFHTDKIKSKNCYFLINHTMNHMFILIGYQSDVKLIEYTFEEAEHFEFYYRYWVTVVQKENLPVSFIILFQDLIEVLSKSHNKVDNMIDEIVFKLKLVP